MSPASDVKERDGGRCVACDTSVAPFSVHHRQLGNRANNTLSNLLLLCGSGTTGCHGVRVHGSSAPDDPARGRRWATDLGYIVTRHGPPEAARFRPVFYNQPSLSRVGWYVLDDNGGLSPAGDTAEGGAGIPVTVPAVTVVHHPRQEAPMPRDINPDPDEPMGDLPSRLPLPLTVRTGQVTLTLDVALSDVVIPGDDKPGGLRLGDLVAANIAAQITPDLPELVDRARIIVLDTIQAEVASIVSRALNRQAGTWPEAKRDDLTLAQLIEAEVWRQVRDPDRNAMARGRTGIPVIEAVVAVAVTEAFRDLTAGIVQQVKAKVLADIATMPT